MTHVRDIVEALFRHPLAWVFIVLLLVVLLILSETAQRAPADGNRAGLLRRWARSMGLDALPMWLFLLICLTWLLIFLTLLLGLYLMIWGLIWAEVPSGGAETWDWRFGLAQIVALTTILGAVIALPLTMQRLRLASRQTETAEQGLITDRINKAVEGLGAEKTARRDGEERTQPNLEVRIGAIYALERIARDSDRDHVQIMEILCAYIRHNAPAPVEDDWPGLEMRQSEEDGPLGADWEERLAAFREAQERSKTGLKVREDIQTALTVIGRRGPRQRRLEAGWGTEADFVFDMPCPDYDEPEDGHDPAKLDEYLQELSNWKSRLDGYSGYRLDLRRCNLRGADLSELNFNGAMLGNTHLQGADLIGTRLKGGNLWHTQLQDACADNAELQGADLYGVRMQRATAISAQFQGADMEGARMQQAELAFSVMHGANLTLSGLEGSSLTLSQMQGTLIQGTWLAGTIFSYFPDITGADFRGSALRKSSLGRMSPIESHLPVMFGDDSVTLPDGARPAHWPDWELDIETFHSEWRRWRADPEGYGPPGGGQG